MSNFIPPWFPLTASQFATSQSWGLGTKSSRLSTPTNEHVKDGLTSGSLFLDTELNFIFKSVVEWAQFQSKSFHDFDEAVNEYFDFTESQFSSSVNHIYQVNGDETVPALSLGHVVGGAFTTNGPAQLTYDLPNPQTVWHTDHQVFGCIQSITTNGASRQFNFYSGSFDSQFDYVVEIVPLEPGTYYHCTEADRTQNSFVVAEYELNTDNLRAQKGANRSTRAGWYDVVVTSMKAVTGSLSLP